MSQYKIYNILGQEYVLLDDLKPKTTETNESQINSSPQTTKQQDFEFTQVEIDQYWQKAANSQRRELFMNTISPILKKELGYEFSEIILEEKAKVLCARWIYCEENDKKYDGPYLID